MKGLSLRLKQSGTTIPTEMNRAFQNYYMNLYMSESLDTNVLHPLLDQLSIPALEKKVKEELDSPIVWSDVPHERREGIRKKKSTILQFLFTFPSVKKIYIDI